jgi:hypothetical protein
VEEPMLKRDVFEIIAKIFGHYCVVQLIRSTPAVIGAIVIDQPDFITNKPLYIMTMSLYPLVFLFLAVIFLWKSNLITKLFYSESSPMDEYNDQIKNESPPYTKLSFWIVIIGFYYLISATASVLSGLPSIFMKLREGWFFTHDPFLSQTLILLMSLVCIFKSEKIEEVIKKVKYKKT